MIDEIKIDEAVAEVTEAMTIGGYGSLFYNWLRVFRRVYGETGYRFFVNECLREYGAEKDSRKKWELPESRSKRFKVFRDISAAYNGVIKRGFDDLALFTDKFVYLESGFFICKTGEAIEIQEELTKFLPEAEEDVPYIGYILTSNGNIACSRIPINKIGEDISENYNDDIPTERLVEVLKEKKSSISILHGIPGCGKTTYIRKLIADNKDLDFYWLDARLLDLVTNETFINFLINHNNAVYIIEDCETLLKDRGEFGNSPLASLLNISDGMLGDSLNIKFLCTFNADLKRIDPAVLRKGRLKVKYEFKELCAEKVKVLADKLGINIPEIKPMPLCEIYNFEQDNGVKPVPQRKRVGF